MFAGRNQKPLVFFCIAVLLFVLLVTPTVASADQIVDLSPYVVQAYGLGGSPLHIYINPALGSNTGTKSIIKLRKQHPDWSMHQVIDQIIKNHKVFVTSDQNNNLYNSFDHGYKTAFDFTVNERSDGSYVLVGYHVVGHIQSFSNMKVMAINGDALTVSGNPNSAYSFGSPGPEHTYVFPDSIASVFDKPGCTSLRPGDYVSWKWLVNNDGNVISARSTHVLYRVVAYYDSASGTLNGHPFLIPYVIYHGAVVNNTPDDVHNAMLTRNDQYVACYMYGDVAKSPWRWEVDYVDLDENVGGSLVALSLNGEILRFNNAVPEIVNGRTMIPVRALSDDIGYSVAWDPADQAVSITNGAHNIVLYVGKSYALINGARTALDVDPFIQNGRVYVPIRVIMEAFGATVSYDPSRRIVNISASGVSQVPLPPPPRPKEGPPQIRWGGGLGSAFAG